jgi:formate dehydrogenase subunit gamma
MTKAEMRVMTGLRPILSLLVVLFLSFPLMAQEQPAQPDRSATGGAQTLEDIMARQRGEPLDDAFRREATGTDTGSAATGQLGTLGGASDPELWRALRYGSADVTSTSRGPAATILVQDGGMWWLQFREGPLLMNGLYLLGGTIIALILFFFIRGKIKIDGTKTGRRVERFKAFERFGHWLMAVSFIILGITGLISLAGRKFLIPAFGHETFAFLAVGSKWVHNNVSWAFMLGLILVFFMWIWHNLPDRTDLKWIAKGGGIIGSGHPPAKKFNAGQKLIFWSVILLGASISASGLSLLFPFELPMFAVTFAKLNALGIPQLLGFGELTTTLAPHQEMQYAQLWHAMISFVLMAIILAHIYIGSVGMEGAYDAMGSGQVEEQWAREHHSLWMDEVSQKATEKPTAPAE